MLPLHHSVLHELQERAVLVILQHLADRIGAVLVGEELHCQLTNKRVISRTDHGKEGRKHTNDIVSR